MLPRVAHGRIAAPVFVVLCLFSLQAFRPLPEPPSSDRQEKLTEYRNLGKAFYENPTTQAQAIHAFKKALDLAPNCIPRPEWIALRVENDIAIDSAAAGASYRL